MLETDVRSDRVTSFRPRVAARAVAQVIGASARSGAGVLAHGGIGPAALVVVVADGPWEGSGRGFSPASVLTPAAPASVRARNQVTAAAVAGLGWAVVAAPSVLRGGGSAEQPLVLLGALGAVALGLALGFVPGVARTVTSRGAARHPGRWAVANAAAQPRARGPVSGRRLPAPSRGPAPEQAVPASLA